MSTETLAERLARYQGPNESVPPPPMDARLSQHQDQPREVIELARQRHRQAPQDARVTDWLAYLLYANRAYDEAIPLLQELVRTAAATALQHFHLANCYGALGASERAVDHWEIAARLAPGSEIARKSVARLRYLALQLAR